jgi:transcriptional regulator with XRE-family HTH domain
MPNEKMQRKKAILMQVAAPDGITRIEVTPLPISEMRDDAPWAKLTVKPVLGPIMAEDPERGIAKRIAYCRGQMDNLSFEALARYTRYFDEKGIAPTSLMRYESGEYLPGARELRILCDAFWVPAHWLLFGTTEQTKDGLNASAMELASALRSFIVSVTGAGLPEGALLQLRHKEAEQQEKHANYERRVVARRQTWLWEARNKSKK